MLFHLLLAKEMHIWLCAAILWLQVELNSQGHLQKWNIRKLQGGWRIGQNLEWGSNMPNPRGLIPIHEDQLRSSKAHAHMLTLSRSPQISTGVVNLLAGDGNAFRGHEKMEGNHDQTFKASFRNGPHFLSFVLRSGATIEPVCMEQMMQHNGLDVSTVPSQYWASGFKPVGFSVWNLHFLPMFMWQDRCFIPHKVNYL